LNVDKEASSSGGPPIRALLLDPAGGLPSPDLLLCPPNHGDRSTPMLGLHATRHEMRSTILQLLTLHVYGFPRYSRPTYSSWLQQAGMFLIISSSVVYRTIQNSEVLNRIVFFIENLLEMIPNRFRSFFRGNQTEPNDKKIIPQTPTDFQHSMVAPPRGIETKLNACCSGNIVGRINKVTLPS